VAAELALGQQHGAAKLRLERDKAEAEAALERERMALDYSLAERRFQAEQGGRRRSRGRRPAPDDEIPAMRPGGALDQ
jgi:hypothetical protein